MQNNINEKNGTIIVKRTLNHLKAKAKGVVLVGVLCAGAIIWARSCMIEDKMCEIKCPQGTELVWHSKKDIELRQNIKGKILSLPNICDEKENSKCEENVPICEETKPVVAPPVVTQPVAHKPPPKKPICGDKKCETAKGENVNNCAEDCGKCGDGVISRSIGEKCEPPNKGCGPDEKCVGCKTCTPKPEPVAVNKCDPKLVTDSRANLFKRAGNAGIKSMASELASMSVSWEAYQCEPGKIEVNLEIQGNADSDTKRRLKSAIISKLEAKGFPLDMRIKSGMTDIVP